MVGVRFHARTPHILIMTELFFATYDDLVLVTKAWKMYGPLSYIVVNILIDLAIATQHDSSSDTTRVVNWP